METDNTTATGYSNGTIKQKRTKAMDMHFYWIKDRVKQGQFHIYWGPGYRHLADHFTKHHSPAHHKQIRNVYIHADEGPINREGIRDSKLRRVLIPQVRPAHKYLSSPWEIIHPPWGDNAVCMYPHTVYTAECDKSLTATYKYKMPIPSNKLLVNNILTNN
jgi:hypothetical protein